MRLWPKAASIGVVLALAGAWLASGSPASAAPAAAPAAPSRSASAPPKTGGPGSGSRELLRGTVVTDEGKRYTGVLRWGDQEAFWDDRFDGTKEDLPYLDRQPEKDRPHGEIRFLGFIPIGYWEEGEKGRRFTARFGDIKEIQPQSGDLVEVTMKNGTRYRLDGGSDDIGATIHVDDPKAGIHDLEWNRIERILFEPAPADAAQAKASRLFGEVVTDSGTFKGFILWDSQECLGTDRLDGDAKNERISLEMGQIRTIEKKGFDRSLIETRDGRKLELSGTNDVNDSIRGILVEDERYGRVNVSWAPFQRLELREPPADRRSYGDYQPGRPLRGTVTSRDGKKWRGRIVFDLDESETWEMLDGGSQGIEYSVPFERVRALEPRPDKTTVVSLRNGQTLRLEGSQDVSEKNAGVLVMKEGAEPEHYVPWGSVARIELD